MMNKFSVKYFFILSMVISPIFLLIISGWMTRIVAVCALLAMFMLYKTKQIKISNKLVIKNLHLLSITFALPFVAIFLGQLFRGDYTWQYYDSPAHILICVFVLWAMLKTHSRVVEWMSFSFPIANLLALVNIVVKPNLFWGKERLSTQALDPLEFGSLSLTFALLSLLSIKLHQNKSKWLVFYKLIGFGVGLYLSVASGSRTGWLAFPIVGGLWLYLEHRKYTITTKLLAIMSATILMLAGYFLSTTIHQRINTATSEISNYQWDKTNKDSSVGARISFARMAVFLMQKKPLSGWGDGGFAAIINDAEFNFAQLKTKKIALISGFHNDITANMVRSGVWGLIATVALFFMPALFFIRNIQSSNKNIVNVAFIGLIFLVCQFVSSLTMEILNLRYSASFYGLMIAIFCGQILYFQQQASDN